MSFNLWKLDDHPELVSALFAAHREAAIANDNASKLCVQQAWGGSGRFENAIIAGMATIGALHAPLVAARDLWESDNPACLMLGEDGESPRWPGFGNSFHKCGDPAFRGVVRVLDEKYTKKYGRLIWLHSELQTYVGVSIPANAAIYTAIVASICEVPRGLEPALFALARIPAWAQLCGETRHPVVGGVR